MEREAGVRGLLFVTILLVYNGCCRPSADQHFKEMPFPKQHSPEWFLLDDTSKVYDVFIKSGLVKLRPHTNNSVHILDLPQGKLIGINHGEWGGALYYQPKDTIPKRFWVNDKPLFNTDEPRLSRREKPVGTIRHTLLLTRLNPDSVFNYKDSLYCLAGLTHDGSNDGSIYQIIIKGDSINVKKVIHFNDAPTALTVYDDKLYVLTSRQLILVQDRKQKVLLDSGIWQGMFGRSIVAKNEREMYIGMRGGYAKVDPTAKKTSFFKFIGGK